MKKYPSTQHVKSSLLFLTPTKKLKNLKKVVQNWLEKHEYFYFDSTKITEKQFLLVLYYALRSREFDLRDKDKEIELLQDSCADLKEQNNKLNDELKAYKYAGYIFQVVRVDWDCGDGCCSDSWYEYKVKDGAKNNIDVGGGKESKEYIQQKLREKYGSKIKFQYLCRDSGSENLNYVL